MTNWNQIEKEFDLVPQPDFLSDLPHYNKAIKLFFKSKFEESRLELVQEIEKLARMNTYEGDEALVYKTTMTEIINLINKVK